MKTDQQSWISGSAPVAVVLISLNEGHNMEEVLENLKGWAQEVFLVDSCSTDKTIDIALRYGVHVVQRRFRGFGDQWNFALSLPISASWTMKMDPDERLSDDLKDEILAETQHINSQIDSFNIPIRLFFMKRKLPSVLKLKRLWRTGSARFSSVDANEHVLTKGITKDLRHEIRHLDSPDLDHWVTKQNRYTTAEAISQFNGHHLSVPPKLFGDALQRRMWVKKYFWLFPARYQILFFYHLFVIGAWRAGRVGWIWSHLRTEVYRQWEYKRYEIALNGRVPTYIPSHAGDADPRVPYFE